MVDRAASAVSASDGAGSENPTFVPPADVFETEEAVVMLFDMPGADPDSLNVTIDGRALTVSARSTPSVPQGYTLLHAEYGDGSYERAFTLSGDVDDEGIDAVFRDGVLRLTLRKATAPRAKKVVVKSA